MITVGAQLSADNVLEYETLAILALGLIAFASGTIGGVLFAKLDEPVRQGKSEPADWLGRGVPAVPMAARISHNLGQEANPRQLPASPHAHGPQRSGRYRLGRCGGRLHLVTELKQEQTLARQIKVQIGEQWYLVELDDISANPVRALVDGVPLEVEVEGLPTAQIPGTSVASGVSVNIPAGQVTQVRTPMLGVIVSVAVSVGQRVSASDPLCVLEALKLQQSIRAPVEGVVRRVLVQPGQDVIADQVIAELV